MRSRSSMVLVDHVRRLPDPSLFSRVHGSKKKATAAIFAYMNLFVASMLTLCSADNLLLLYLGWEGVGSAAIC